MALSKCPLEGWISGAQRAKNETPPVTPKLKVREVSQNGFWNIPSHPTSEPSFSQIGWPQRLAPGTLSQTMSPKSRLFVITIFTEEWDTSLITSPHEASNTIPADDIEIQILDLKECYKKTRRRQTLKGLVKDHLLDSEVTVMIQASEKISNVRAFTQRCPDAARRTHDTIGRSLLTERYLML